jgi:hypothetical protein
VLSKVAIGEFAARSGGWPDKCRLMNEDERVERDGCRVIVIRLWRYNKRVEKKWSVLVREITLYSMRSLTLSQWSDLMTGDMR